MNVQSIWVWETMNEGTDKRKAILDAALKLISKNGFHGTAVSRVAKEAGVSAGTIYHYFDSKDDLIDDLYRDVYFNLAQVIRNNYDQSQPLEIQIRQIWFFSVRFYLKNPDICAFIQQYKNSPYFRPEMDRETDGYFDFVIALGVQAIEKKIVKNFPKQVFFAFLQDFAGTLSQKHDKGVLHLDNELIEKIIDATWDAIRLKRSMGV
jgi:AcrR family transcriptional regulator